MHDRYTTAVPRTTWIVPVMQGKKCGLIFS